MRVDDGVVDGGEISMFYDPMIAKLITWAPTPRGARSTRRSRRSTSFVIDGISDNIDFLSALMQHPRFRRGDLATDFIADEYPDGFDGAPADAQLIEDLAVIAGMVGGDHRRARGRDRRPARPADPAAVASAWCGSRGESHKVRIKPYDGGTLAVIDDGELVDIVGRWAPGQRLLSRDRRRPPPHRPGPPRRPRLGAADPRAHATGCRCSPPMSPSCRKHMIEKVAARPVAAC